MRKDTVIFKKKAKTNMAIELLCLTLFYKSIKYNSNVLASTVFSLNFIR